MDVHDIRYLHDEGIKAEDEVGDDIPGVSLLTKKNLAGFAVIFVLLLSIGLVLSNLSKPVTTKSSAQIPDETPVPTAPVVSVKGKVTCLSVTPTSSDSCDLGVTSEDGKIYSLENVQFNDVSSGALSPGNVVTVHGSLAAPGAGGGASTGSGSGSSSSKDGGTIYLSDPASGGGISGQPTPTASVPQPTSTPTLTPTVTITPTPSIAPVS
jgi:hypothetical protein